MSQTINELKHPFRCLIFSPSQSGKTSTLKFLMQSHLHKKWRLQWDTIIVTGHTLNDSDYEWADGHLEGLAKDTFAPLKEIVDKQIVAWKRGDRRKLLLVFEDFIGSGFKPLSREHKDFFDSLSTTWRNKGISFIIIVQKLTGAVSPCIRENITHILITKPLKKHDAETVSDMTEFEAKDLLAISSEHITRVGLSVLLPTGALWGKQVTVIDTPAKYATVSE